MVTFFFSNGTVKNMSLSPTRPSGAHISAPEASAVTSFCVSFQGRPVKAQAEIYKCKHEHIPYYPGRTLPSPAPTWLSP